MKPRHWEFPKCFHHGLRKFAKLRALRVIAQTSKPMQGDGESRIDAGASDFIPKPVNDGELPSRLPSGSALRPKAVDKPRRRKRIAS